MSYRTIRRHVPIRLGQRVYHRETVQRIEFEIEIETKDENVPSVEELRQDRIRKLWCLPLVYPPRVVVWEAVPRGNFRSTSEEKREDLDKKTRVQRQAWPERDEKGQGDTFER